MAWPKCGHNAYIYVSGIALQGANAWSISLPSETVEQRKFGDSWVSRCKTFNDWSGNIDAIDDVKTLSDAAMASGSLPLYIYPDRNTTTEYYSGNAIFGHSGGGDTGSNVTAAGDFVGSGALAVNGFS